MKFVLSDNLHQSQQAKAIGNRGYTNKVRLRGLMSTQ